VARSEWRRSCASAGPAPEPEPEAPRSIEERRRAIHDKAQQALGQMNQSDPDG
jgi:hypothetical protein